MSDIVHLHTEQKRRQILSDKMWRVCHQAGLHVASSDSASRYELTRRFHSLLGMRDVVTCIIIADITQLEAALDFMEEIEERMQIDPEEGK